MSSRVTCEADIRIFGERVSEEDHWARKFYLVMDPIDGTKGFIRNGQFAVGLALVDGSSGLPQVGIIGCPNLSESLKSIRRQLVDVSKINVPY